MAGIFADSDAIHNPQRRMPGVNGRKAAKRGVKVRPLAEASGAKGRGRFLRQAAIAAYQTVFLLS
ncbi:hypothetical protein EGK14_18210 [Erwinia sp. 198]|nr:hypothetical protein EGK14_18210 [Erwinia sp. 198]